MPTPTIDLLEEMLTAGGECKCEHPHVKSTCSHEVTHMYRTCLWEAFICANGVRSLESGRSGNYSERFQITCIGCRRSAEKCWTLIPV